MRNELGEVTHYIGIQSDVTARREAENGLRRAKEALELTVVPPSRVAERLNRLRDRPLREGLDHVANLVQDWSGDNLRDDVSLLAVERVD